MYSYPEGKKAILAVSDGTTDRAQLQNTVDAAASYLRERFGLAAVYPSYTDKSVRRKLRRRDGIRTDDVQEALERARTDGFLYIFVQPFYITDCREYRKMLEEVDARVACGCYAAAEAGRPLITSREDVRRAADVLADELPDVRCDYTGIFLMGCDGSDGEKRILQNLTEDLNERIPERFFCDGCDMRVPVKNGRIRKISVLPLEFSFQEDFFDDPEKKAVKRYLESLGYEVKQAGMSWGEAEGIRRMFGDTMEKTAGFQSERKGLHEGK